MRTYRLYCLNENGKTVFVDWLKADNDADAILKARAAKAHEQKCEIWELSRLVANLNRYDLAG